MAILEVSDVNGWAGHGPGVGFVSFRMIGLGIDVLVEAVKELIKNMEDGDGARTCL